MPGLSREAERFPLVGAFGLYTLAFAALAFPWLSGAVEIPYDAASQFYPQLAFLARSLAAGQSPFWTPNIFAGWPQIADPQSLIFSPLHFIVALLVAKPKPVAGRSAGVCTSLCRRRRRHPVFPRPRLAHRRRAGRGAGIFIRRLGRLAHPARRPDRKPGVPAAGAVDAGAGAGALVVAGRIGGRCVRRVRRDRTRSGLADRGLSADRLRVLALAVGSRPVGKRQGEREAAGRRCGRRGPDRHRPGHVDRAARAAIEPSGDRLCLRLPRARCIRPIC